MQYCTDRLDPPLVPIRVDDALLLVSFRIQLTHPASTPKKIDAADRISFARFSSGVLAFRVGAPAPWPHSLSPRGPLCRSRFGAPRSVGS